MSSWVELTGRDRWCNHLSTVGHPLTQVSMTTHTLSTPTGRKPGVHHQCSPVVEDQGDASS